MDFCRASVVPSELIPSVDTPHEAIIVLDALWDGTEIFSPVLTVRCTEVTEVASEAVEITRTTLLSLRPSPCLSGESCIPP